MLRRLLVDRDGDVRITWVIAGLVGGCAAIIWWLVWFAGAEVERWRAECADACVRAEVEPTRARCEFRCRYEDVARARGSEWGSE
jgi:hypothetical protein